ncbi:unnamed protein product [Rhizopus stolonifer]
MIYLKKEKKNRKEKREVFDNRFKHTHTHTHTHTYTRTSDIQYIHGCKTNKYFEKSLISSVSFFFPLNMKQIRLYSILFAISATAAELCTQTNRYTETLDYTHKLQDLIDEAIVSKKSFVHLDVGIYFIDPQRPIQLKGVSLKGNYQHPSIITVLDKNTTGTIQVDSRNNGWSIQDLVFENVHVEINNQKSLVDSTISRNLFFNGGRGSIMAQQGARIRINGNIFLRDEMHTIPDISPTYDTTNTGVLFQTQKNSVVSNNIFGMDLRKFDALKPVIHPSLNQPYKQLGYIHSCLNRSLSDEQGYLASGVQLYNTNDITIRENIMNATFPDTKHIFQDHGISVVGSNKTFIYQNFIAGWQIGDFGGAVRFTSAVDGYVVSNYLANTAVMLYTALHADFLQISNIAIHKNFLFRFLGKEMSPPDPLDGWLYEGISFYDFYTARQNYTSRIPIWDSTVPISPFGSQIMVTSNRFGAAEGLDPNVISFGNLDYQQGFAENNCYVTEPLDYDPITHDSSVSLLWRQIYEQDKVTKNGGKIPKKMLVKNNGASNVLLPFLLGSLPIPDFYKAFRLKNNTTPMLSPDMPCYSQ